MLVIHPDECIDCGVCEPECPVEAILSDTEDGIEKWAEINRKYSEIWPNINEKKEPPVDAEEWQNTQDKFNKFLEKNSFPNLKTYKFNGIVKKNFLISVLC